VCTCWDFWRWRCLHAQRTRAGCGTGERGCRRRQWRTGRRRSMSLACDVSTWQAAWARCQRHQSTESTETHRPTRRSSRRRLHRRAQLPQSKMSSMTTSSWWWSWLAHYPSCLQSVMSFHKLTQRLTGCIDRAVSINCSCVSYRAPVDKRRPAQGSRLFNVRIGELTVSSRSLHPASHTHSPYILTVFRTPNNLTSSTSALHATTIITSFIHEAGSCMPLSAQRPIATVKICREAKTISNATKSTGLQVIHRPRPIIYMTDCQWAGYMNAIALLFELWIAAGRRICHVRFTPLILA